MPGAATSAKQVKSPLQRAFPAILFGYVVILIVCGLLIDGTRGRTFIRQDVERHFYLGWLVAIACVYVITYCVVLSKALRAAWSWKSRVAFGVVYLFLALRWVLFVAVLPMTIMEAMFYHLPRTPFHFQTVVMEADGYRSRGSRVQTVTFADPAGKRVRVRESDWKPLHLFTPPLSGNEGCSLEALQPGQPITVYARKSSLGFAIDGITSPVACAPVHP